MIRQVKFKTVLVGPLQENTSPCKSMIYEGSVFEVAHLVAFLSPKDSFQGQFINPAIYLLI